MTAGLATARDVYDFTNVILIATSNAGTAYVQEQNKNGVAHEVLLNQLCMAN